MTTVDNASVVNHVGLGDAAVKAQETDHELVEAALEREEEAAMDEEIHSDNEDPMTDTIEKQMLTVALVKSVVDSGKKPETASSEAESEPANSSTRYGLRKRRRPGDSSPETETVEDSAADQSNESPSQQDSPRTRRRKLKVDAEESSKLPAIEDAPGEKLAASSEQAEVKMEEPPPTKIDIATPRIKVEEGTTETESLPKPQEVETTVKKEPPTTNQDSAATQAPPEPVVASANTAMVAPSLAPTTTISSLPVDPYATTKHEETKAVAQPQAKTVPLAVPVTTSSVPDPTKVKIEPSQVLVPSKAKTAAAGPKPTSKKAPTKPRAKPQKPRQKSAKAGGKKKNTLAPVTAQRKLVPTSSAVPNPLAAPIDTGSTLLMPPPAPAGVSTSVPCPLPSVPCPLPPVSFQEKPVEAPPPERKVTINEPPVTTRSRVFSVDLDPSTFDFPEFKGGDTELERVPEVDPANAVDAAVLQRDRAYSFEFFNFTGDDLLPSAPETSSALPDPASSVDVPPSEYVAMRPRGDSIIFDPVSFQDGGIHEKNALLKARATSIGSAGDGLLYDSNKYTPANVGVASHPTPAPETNVPTAAAPAEIVPTNSDAASGEMATLPSALSANTVNGASPATFQLELLNKDGRIGIYLPEARKARIARFHAKRKMRIWRKRIKYDCRKKLADSRPRIKGRFVKRSDVDD